MPEAVAITKPMFSHPAVVVAVLALRVKMLTP
jgi:hypothetical protein